MRISEKRRFNLRNDNKSDVHHPSQEVPRLTWKPTEEGGANGIFSPRYNTNRANERGLKSVTKTGRVRRRAAHNDSAAQPSPNTRSGVIANHRLHSSVSLSLV